ncbi:hypothetical protein VNO77_42736 [Canavalia gladiata]|uniref:Uncharacterized protein n=1 Tax=Canavalia gladiata TaxID=3824 RepID=A0AAN9JST6_CANGL
MLGNQLSIINQSPCYTFETVVIIVSFCFQLTNTSSLVYLTPLKKIRSKRARLREIIERGGGVFDLQILGFVSPDSESATANSKLKASQFHFCSWKGAFTINLRALKLEGCSYFFCSILLQFHSQQTRRDGEDECRYTQKKLVGGCRLQISRFECHRSHSLDLLGRETGRVGSWVGGANWDKDPTRHFGCSSYSFTHKKSVPKSIIFLNLKSVTLSCLSSSSSALMSLLGYYSEGKDEMGEG